MHQVLGGSTPTTPRNPNFSPSPTFTPGHTYTTSMALSEPSRYSTSSAHPSGGGGNRDSYDPARFSSSSLSPSSYPTRPTSNGSFAPRSDVWYPPPPAPGSSRPLSNGSITTAQVIPPSRHSPNTLWPDSSSSPDPTVRLPSPGAPMGEDEGEVPNRASMTRSVYGEFEPIPLDPVHTFADRR
ncbi:hypothetical protein T439DRAFT_329349 [Meredithblackwellia eburnea MCA 4105]